MMDRSAFEDLYLENYPRVLAFAMRRTNPALADDVVAGTFLVAWRRRKEIEGDPLPWLLGIARRVLANHLRAARRTEALAARARAQVDLPAGLEPDIAIADRRVALALKSLAARDREALILTAWDDLSPAEAARVAGCSATAFRVRLHRARKRFATALEKLDFSERARAQKGPATTFEPRG
jgi:RNA polymerase sigma-70 factor (ECF subfamily)